MDNPNTEFATWLIASLEAAGVTHASVAPGSRNTPLSLALADSPIHDVSHHDERSAAFFALGVAKATGRPAAVVTTSGTAATELHPAIAEADAAAVPLIALTADRPTELLGRAAPQTIDQRELFGPMVRWHVDIDVDRDTGTPEQAAALGRRAITEAMGVPPGPVHCNLRFREPLLIGGGGDVRLEPAVVARSTLAPEEASVEAAVQMLASRSGVIVVGPETWREGSAQIAALGRSWGWPVLSDPLSGLRSGLADTDGIVGSDLLASAGWLESNPPEAVLRFGAPPTSKALNLWLGHHPDVPQVVVAPSGTPDPTRTASMFLRGHPLPTATALGSHDIQADSEWSSLWARAHATAEATVSTAIENIDQVSEPGVAAAIGRAAGGIQSLWANSSMPIRDIDSYFPVTPDPVAIHGNRGANGIDGFVSTALGAASRPTVAFTGDVGMLHDVGSLAAMSRLAPQMAVVVVNNDGGGIFHFLPQAGHDHFERHFGTPHGLSFAAIAAGFGLRADRIDDIGALDAALANLGPEPRLIEVVTDRHANVDHHARIGDAVRDALDGLG